MIKLPSNAFLFTILNITQNVTFWIPYLGEKQGKIRQPTILLRPLVELNILTFLQTEAQEMIESKLSEMLIVKLSLIEEHRVDFIPFWLITSVKIELTLNIKLNGQTQLPFDFFYWQYNILHCLLNKWITCCVKSLQSEDWLLGQELMWYIHLL